MPKFTVQVTVHHGQRRETEVNCTFLGSNKTVKFRSEFTIDKNDFCLVLEEFIEHNLKNGYMASMYKKWKDEIEQ